MKLLATSYSSIIAKRGSNPKRETRNYSDLKLFTGFINPALMAW